VLPRVRRLDSRYLVWTGSDGTPHVQPLAVLPFAPSKTACARMSSAVRVTPAITDFACGPFGAAPVFRAPMLVPSLPKTSARARAAARERARARTRTRTRRALTRRTPARRRKGVRPVPLGRYAPLPVCAPLATVVPIAPRTGRLLPRAVAPRITAPTATVPPRGPAPTATAPRPVPAPAATVPRPVPAPTVTVPARPRTRTTP
jgi:hypothetical protein